MEEYGQVSRDRCEETGFVPGLHVWYVGIFHHVRFVSNEMGGSKLV